MTSINKEPSPQQQIPSSSSASMPVSMTMEDELKRSTDCIYFLASNCKKGSECEYRHSETARNNHTDCYYWLNMSCSLKAKCSYRHPPLDVMMPPYAGNYAAPPPAMLFSGPHFTSTPQNGTKQAVPCLFFPKGTCSKGDKCAFLHGPIPSTNIQPIPAKSAAIEAPTTKKTSRDPEKDPQFKPGFYSNASKSTETPRQPQAKSAALKIEKPQLMEEAPAAKHYPPHSVLKEAANYREARSPPADNWSLRSCAARSHHTSLVDDQNFQNGEDNDDSLRESSPGFDVLVDDKLEEDEYYHNEDQYLRTRGQEGRRSSEFDVGRHDDYNSVTDIDHDDYRSKRDYHAYDGLRDKYHREPRGASSERLSALGRRGPYKPEIADVIRNPSDLRNRLSKQRSGNGLRSVISPDYKPDYLPERRDYHGSRRDIRRSPMRESSFGSRLQGRIKLPRRSPPAGVGNRYSDRDNERGRYSGRLSPSRPRLSSHQGRLRDRLGERVKEERNKDRNFSSQIREDSTFRTNGDVFTGPKRFSELKGTKHTDDQQSVPRGNLGDTVLTSSLGAGGDISFDGPRPLSEILKRKRNASRTPSSGVVNFENDGGTKRNNEPEQLQCDLKEDSEPLIAVGDEEEADMTNKRLKLMKDESSTPDNVRHPDVEETGLFVGVEHEPEVDEGFNRGDGEEPDVDEGFDQGDGEGPEVDEGFDQGDEEYDYEQDDDAEGYNLNGGDVADDEGFMDEDDGDDFAKKLGVSF